MESVSSCVGTGDCRSGVELASILGNCLAVLNTRSSSSSV